MEFLNQCSGLFSLLAVLASIIVPIVIFKKQRKYDEEAEKRRDDKELTKIQDRIDAKKEANASPLARAAGVTDELEEKIYLEKQLGRNCR